MSTFTTATPIVTFKKPPRRPQASRKRSTSPSSSTQETASTSASATPVIRPAKKSLVNPLIQGTKRRRDPAEENGGGLDEMDYRADEGLIGGRGDVYATRSTDYDLDDASRGGGDDGGRRALGEKKVRLNEVCHPFSNVMYSIDGCCFRSLPHLDVLPNSFPSDSRRVRVFPLGQ